MSRLALMGGLLWIVGCGQTVVHKADPGLPSGRSPEVPPMTESKPEPSRDSNVNQAKKPGYNESRLHQVGDLAQTQVTIGRAVFRAWVMDTDSKRAEGMMFLTKAEVPEMRGMLFVFPDEAERSFWMRNTLIDLDIAYLRKNGTVVSISTMKALDETGVPSKGPAMYALEVVAGTFKRYGIKPGMRAKIAPPVRSAD